MDRWELGELEHTFFEYWWNKLNLWMLKTHKRQNYQFSWTKLFKLFKSEFSISVSIFPIIFVAVRQPKSKAFLFRKLPQQIRLKLITRIYVVLERKICHLLIAEYFDINFFMFSFFSLSLMVLGIKQTPETP